MIGHRFRVNKDFFNTAKDKDNKPLGRRKIAENTTITVIDTEIRNGIRWSKLDHSIGWVNGKNRIWNKLDLM